MYVLCFPGSMLSSMEEGTMLDPNPVYTASTEWQAIKNT